MVSVSIIIPAYNEEATIERTVLSFYKELKKSKIAFEIIICNDHSSDNTKKIGQRLHKKYSQIKVLDNTNERGFGNVYRFGLTKAKNEYILPVMADMCDNPKTIHLMLKKVKEGYDVVVGSRYIKRGGKKNVQNKIKSFLSWGAGFFGYHIQRIPTHDTTNAFKLMKRKAINSIKLKSNGFDISMEATMKLHKKGFSIAEVPTIWTDRSAGTSKFIVHQAIPKYLRWWYKLKG